MNYLETDLGHLGAERAVQFTLQGHAANVRIVDPINLARFKRGDKFQYVGGHATQSPVIVRIPSPGHWHALVDLGGAPGQVRASVRVLGTKR